MPGGRLVAEFGDGGSVDLKVSIRGDVDGGFSLVSPPAVYRNIIITGGNNGEQAPSSDLYGEIRGGDAHTGKLLWSFHTGPRPGEPGVETWEGDSWQNRSGTNVWSFFTIDVERGIVFAPLGSPTSDYYGGDRKGANLYGNSLVALDAATGKLKWHQQLVHHDLWDYDLPAAPTLVDVKGNGRTIPAVAAMTKMGLLFLFDRVTGAPIFGMEERSVPQSTVPGEASWPTQPFPAKPAPLARITFNPEQDFYALTPDHAAYCKELWSANQMYTKGPYTPPGVDGTMVTFPSTLGGGNWNGLSLRPDIGSRLHERDESRQVAKMVQGARRRRSDDVGTPLAVGGPVGRFWNPETKIPCSAPPFGELVAVDVNRGEIAWKVPIGFVESLKAKNITNTGALNIGGSIVTAGGVLFIGATNDHRFRAFDSRNGKQLWETELEASAHSVPMTFLGATGASMSWWRRRRKLPRFAFRNKDRRAPRPGAEMRVLRVLVIASADALACSCPDATAQARPRVGRRSQRLPARRHFSRARNDRTPGMSRARTIRSSAPIRSSSRSIRSRSKPGQGSPPANSFSRTRWTTSTRSFFGVREIDPTSAQRADLPSFVRDDGKGFVAAHSGSTGFFSWPEFWRDAGRPLRRTSMGHQRGDCRRRRSGSSRR
jgi:outer membrane protein assembly factor BamB